MTEYRNRSERRSLQRVELRKIRTNYKQSMKAFRSKYFDYNPKKFRKTLFHLHLKQASVVITENTSVDCNYQDTTETDTSGEYLSDTSASKINTAEDIPVTLTYQEEGYSTQTDSDMAIYNYECVPITGIYQGKEIIRVVSYCNDQAIRGIDINKEEYNQANTQVLSDALGHIIENTLSTDTAEKTFSIQTNMHTALGNVEGIIVPDVSEVEYSSIPSNATNSLTTNKNITTALHTECSQEVDPYNETSAEDNNSLSLISMGVSYVSKEKETQPESIAADTLGYRDIHIVADEEECDVAEALISDTGAFTVISDKEKESEVVVKDVYINISADKEECEAVEARSSESGTFTVIADKEATIIVKDVDLTQDVESFKLEWNTSSLISGDMFEGFLDTLNELQARTNILVNAADPENTQLVEDLKPTEEHLDEKEDDVRKDDEAGQEDEDDERSLVPEKKINSSISEKPIVKEVSWLLTPPSSIMSIVYEEKTSSSVTPPQSVNDVVFNKPLYVQPSIMGKVEEAAAVSAIGEMTFSPVKGNKKKRFRTLRVSFHLKKIDRTVN